MIEANSAPTYGRLKTLLWVCLVLWLGGKSLFLYARNSQNWSLQYDVENLMVITDVAGLLAIAIIGFFAFRRLSNKWSATIRSEEFKSGSLHKIVTFFSSVRPRTYLIVSASLLAFWFVDLPWTVRLKSSFVNLLPLSDATKAEVVKSLCVNAYGPNWLDCYYVNR